MMIIIIAVILSIENWDTDIKIPLYISITSHDQ